MTRRDLVHDPTLKGLRVALLPEAVSHLLSEALGEPHVVQGIDLVKHKLGKRCALAYTVEGPGGVLRFFAKTFRTERGARIYGAMQRVHDALEPTQLRVPAPLLYAPKPKLLVTEFLDGTALGTPLYAGLSLSAARRAAQAAAALHRAQARFSRRWSARHELENTAQWVSGLGATASSLLARARAALAAAEELATSLSEDSHPCPVHRDYYLEQLWDLGQERTALLDLDDLREGDPAVDVGNFLAHLTLRGLQFPASREPCTDARPVFLESYVKAAGPRAGKDFERRVRFYELTTSIRLVGVYAARQRWAETLPSVLLETAESLIVAPMETL